MFPEKQFLKVSGGKSSMLLFFEFLLKVGLIPLNVNLSKNQLQFKMFSKSTLLFNTNVSSCATPASTIQLPTP